jgi:ABC-type proline/glycine betaine transport system permease subunit
VRRDFPTLIVVGAVCTTALAVLLDLALVGAERLTQPWLRAGRA